MTTRRNVLRSLAILGGTALLGSSPLPARETAAGSACPNTIYSTMLGWRIGPQIYSFKRFPFDEAIRKVKATGSLSFELYRGQILTRGSDVKVGPGMAKDDFKRLRELIAESGCVPHAMGVCPADREHFEFALSLGISHLNVEPAFDKLGEVDKMADEYLLSVGLHNHPKPSIYWDPNLVAEKLKDCGSRIGACCDTGHWVRSGLDPLEAVRMLKGRIVSFHIKDLVPNAAVKHGYGDVPLGQGVCKIADILKEAADQKVRGPFSIEYESNWDANMSQIAEGIRFFNETAKAIVLG